MPGRLYPTNTATLARPASGRLYPGGVWQRPDLRQEMQQRHTEMNVKMQEQGKKIDAQLEKEANPSFWDSTKNFFGSFKPQNIKQTAQNVVQDVKQDPVGAAEAVPKGLLDAGSTVLNTGFDLLGKFAPGEVKGKKLTTFSEEYDKAVHPDKQETDTSMALRTAATNVAGYELGGAAVRGLGLTGAVSRVVGNVAGGQLTAGSEMTFKDRAKQAAFDSAFGLATEVISKSAGLLKSKPLGETKVEVPIEAPINAPEQTLYKTKKLGVDASGEKVLGRTEYDSKTGRVIIYLDPSLDANPTLKTQTIEHELGHVLDKRMNKGSNLSAQLPNYAGNKANLDLVLEDFSAKQNKSVELVVKEINQDIKKLAKGSNEGEQFANAVAEYRKNPEAAKQKAPTFIALLENNPEPPRLVEHQVTAPEVQTKLKNEAGINELNQAKNSLMNSRTGEKPGGIERAKAEIKAGNKPPVKIRTLEDGTKFIEDGRHHLQAATELGIRNYPVEDVTKAYQPKVVESKFSSTGLKTGKTVKTEGYNPSKINAPEETQALFEKLGAKNTNRISKSNEDVRDLARLTGLTEEELMKAKPGSIANAETVTAARQLVLNKAQDLMNYLKGVDVSVATPEQLQGIKDRFVKLVAMQKSVAGLRTEASNVFRSLGLELMPGENATLSELGGILKKAGIASGDDAALFAGKAAKEFNLTGLQKAGQGALSTWYASILSGPKTTARNILSTSANILTEFTSKIGNPKLWKELPTSVSGLLRGLKQGLGEAKDVLKGAQATGKFAETGGMRPSPFDTNFKSPLVNKAVRTYGTVVESVGRFLNAQDTLLKAGAREMESASHAVQGISDKTLSDAISKAYAESTVYHGVPKGRLIGALRDSAQTLRGKFPESKIIIPFVDTVANVLDRQFDYIPVFSQLRLRNSVLMKQVERIAKDYGISGEANLNLIKTRLRDQQIGRMMLGTVVSAAAVGLAAEGKVSGVGPSNVSERMQLQETGWRPNSVKVGNMWIPYANLGPLAGIFSMAGNVYDKTHYDKAPNKSVEALLGKGIIGWTQTQLNSSFLGGAADLFDVISGGTSSEKYLINLGAGLVPIPAAYSQTKDMIWRQQYETRDIQDKLKLKLGITDNLEPRLNAFGKSQKADLIYGLSPSKVKNDPVINFLVENDLVVGRPTVGQQYTIPGTEDKRVLTPEEYTRYLQESGDLIYQQIDAMKDGLRDAPPDIRESEIKKLTDSIRSQIRERILTGQ